MIMRTTRDGAQRQDLSGESPATQPTAGMDAAAACDNTCAQKGMFVPRDLVSALERP